MEQRYCAQCKADKPVLSAPEYATLRILFDQAQRQKRRGHDRDWTALLQPLFREYRALTGEDESNWLHIIVHQLAWQAPATARELKPDIP